VRHSGDHDRNIVHIRHDAGVEVVRAVINDLDGGFGHVDVVGTKGHINAHFGDTFTAFKRQLVAFLDDLRTGVSPVPWDETREQTKIITAALCSRDAGGELVDLADIAP